MKEESMVRQRSDQIIRIPHDHEESRTSEGGAAPHNRRAWHTPVLRRLDESRTESGGGIYADATAATMPS